MAVLKSSAKATLPWYLIPSQGKRRMRVVMVTAAPAGRGGAGCRGVTVVPPCRLVRGGAAAGWPEGLVPLRVCQGDHLQGHPGQEHGAHGAPAGAGNQRVAVSSPRTWGLLQGPAEPQASSSTLETGHPSCTGSNSSTLQQVSWALLCGSCSIWF